MRLFFLSSHTPRADGYVCSLVLLIPWEPYIKERLVWEERTGTEQGFWLLLDPELSFHLELI